MKIVKVMASRATVPGQRGRKNETILDSKKLVEEDLPNSTCFENISQLPERPHVGCIDYRISFE